MKSLTPSSSSSLKSSATIITMEENPSEARGSCYYPGCKKDANCNCEICLASINATLDLMAFSSLTKFSASRPKNNVESTPISFDHASVVSTPRSSSCKIMDSSALKSTARLNANVNVKEMEMERKETHKVFGFRGVFSKLVLVLSLCFAVEFGFSWVVFGALRPELSPDMVRIVGERSCFGGDLNGRLRFLQNELKGIAVHGKVCNCSCSDSKWEIDQWYNGKVGFSIPKANSSWMQNTRGASIMPLDPNTWILEYRRNSILEHARLFATAFEFLKHRMSGAKSKEQLWLFSTFQSQYKAFMGKGHIQIPT